MIHWFPGHMHKAMKEFKKKITQIDIAIEIVDSRIPYSSANQALIDIIQDKPIIKILSKSDLADKKTTQEWIKYFKGKAIAVDTLRDKNINTKIFKLAQRILPNKGTMIRPMCAIIFGLPNVGKSTFINTLAKRKVAKTGNEPTVTKIQQRIDIQDGFIIFDTPGMMFPSPKDEACGYKIATIGSIRDTAMDYYQTAMFLLNFLKSHHPEILRTHYNFHNLNLDSDILIKTIAKQKTNNDIKQASKTIVHDFRKGHFGKISLEKPSDIVINL